MPRAPFSRSSRRMRQFHRGYARADHPPDARPFAPLHGRIPRSAAPPPRDCWPLLARSGRRCPRYRRRPVSPTARRARNSFCSPARGGEARGAPSAAVTETPEEKRRMKRFCSRRAIIRGAMNPARRGRLRSAGANRRSDFQPARKMPASRTPPEHLSRSFVAGCDKNILEWRRQMTDMSRSDFNQAGNKAQKAREDLTEKAKGAVDSASSVAAQTISRVEEAGKQAWDLGQKYGAQAKDQAHEIAGQASE